MIKLTGISILIKATYANILILSLKDLELDDDIKTDKFFREGNMETACDGCHKKQKTKDEFLNGRRGHICRCRSQNGNINKKAEVDQIAVTSDDEKEPSNRKY